jgi:hypothetical protein
VSTRARVRLTIRRLLLLIPAPGLGPRFAAFGDFETIQGEVLFGQAVAQPGLIGLQPVPYGWCFSLETSHDLPLINSNGNGELAEVVGLEPNPRLSPAALQKLQPHRLHDLCGGLVRK